MDRALLAVDWGTSAVRAALLDGDGTVRAAHQTAEGILSVPAGGFPRAFERLVAPLAVPPGTPCLLAGMVGSRQGWREAAYCACPAGTGELRRHLLHIQTPLGAAAIVPGLSTEAGGVPDVMRGEETQVLGALTLLGRREGTFVLPGTHSKWVQVHEGRITGFETCMTGEVFALLRRHSILARSIAPAGDGHDGAGDGFDEAAFRRGIDHAEATGSLLAAAFSARTLALFGRMDEAALPSYLSGLVIGEELRQQRPAPGADPLVVIGAPALTARYRCALQHRGVESVTIGSEATWRGLRALAREGEASA